jgi:hypothetical protein
VDFHPTSLCRFWVSTECKNLLVRTSEKLEFAARANAQPKVREGANFLRYLSTVFAHLFAVDLAKGRIKL